MASTEKMRIYAIVIAIALEQAFPGFEDFDATRAFIEENEIAYRSLPPKLRYTKRDEAKMHFYPVYELESFKLKLKTGNWTTKMFSKKLPPFDTLEALNTADRFEMAYMFWEELTRDTPGWKLVEKLDGKLIEHDKLILYTAKDFDYRVAKATAKYIFRKTTKSAGAVIINPNEPPFDVVKFQFRETYYCLDEEYFYKGLNDHEYRTPISNDNNEKSDSALDTHTSLRRTPRLF